MKKIKMLVAGLAMAALGLFVATAPVSAVTCQTGTLRAGETADTYAQCNLPKEEGNGSSLWTTVQNIINWILAILGVVTVVMIILGGVTYMTSQGDPAKTKRGRDTILYGVVGLVIALLAYAIVNFVLANIFAKSDNTANGNTTVTYNVTTNN